MAKKDIKEIRELSKKQIKETPVEFFHSGCTTLNLALSGKGRDGGFARSRIINLVGDGSSGKTALALEFAFWVWKNGKKIKSENFPEIKKVRIRYNNPEQVMDFPLVQMYGQKFYDAVEWIATPEIEAFGRDYTRQLLEWKPGELVIYILDSYDSFTSEAGLEKFIESAKKDKPEDGSYGMDKASYGSKKFFNNICGLMVNKDVTLVIISQVRANIGVMFGKKYVRAGGKVLDFYTHQVAWLAEKDKLDKTVNGRKLTYGIVSRAKVERNKVSKPFREADFTILFDYGIDDLSSMIDWYYGPKAKEYEFDEQVFKDKPSFIKYLETDKALVVKLQDMVEDAWHEDENMIAPDRKPKYED